MKFFDASEAPIDTPVLCKSGGEYFIGNLVKEDMSIFEPRWYRDVFHGWMASVTPEKFCLLTEVV